jgi:hypothetical protein
MRTACELLENYFINKDGSISVPPILVCWSLSRQSASSVDAELAFNVNPDTSLSVALKMVGDFE